MTDTDRPPNGWYVLGPVAVRWGGTVWIAEGTP